MAEEVKYYADVSHRRTVEEPAGLARRRFTGNGPVDESLGRDLEWFESPAIYEWERGEEPGIAMVEISEDEAHRIIERWRVKWASEDARTDGQS